MDFLGMIPRGGDSPESVSIRTMRLAVGWLGALLPLVLYLGGAVFSCGVVPLDSISDYYHSPMRDAFVGCLCAVAFFLFAYKGYDVSDFWALRVASALALLVAFFPTAVGAVLDCMRVVEKPGWVNAVHLASAAAFFADLAYISIWEFTKFKKGEDKANASKRKLRKNRLFRACGFIILGCLAAIFIILAFWGKSPIMRLKPVFALESVMLLAFGVSWLVKGEMMRRWRAA